MINWMKEAEKYKEQMIRDLEGLIADPVSAKRCTGKGRRSVWGRASTGAGLYVDVGREKRI